VDEFNNVYLKVIQALVIGAIEMSANEGNFLWQWCPWGVAERRGVSRILSWGGSPVRAKAEIASGDRREKNFGH
jgi:hypothetical protein